jgi:hypothetical protein
VGSYSSIEMSFAGGSDIFPGAAGQQPLALRPYDGRQLYGLSIPSLRKPGYLKTIGRASRLELGL